MYSLCCMQSMSPWTRHLDGDKKEDRTPLLPHSNPPDLHRDEAGDSSAEASAPPVDEYPDPVKSSHDSQYAPESGYLVRL